MPECGHGDRPRVAPGYREGMADIELQIIGGGKMGEALLGGMIASGWAPASQLVVVELDESRRAELAARFDGLVVESAPRAGVDALIAVKPQYVLDVCAALSDCRVISIAAGVRINAMEAALPAETSVVRVMPNTPALVGEGAAGLAAGAAATDADVAWASGILAGVGRVHRVDEADLDAVTGVSGSGPAYVFLLAEAMTAAAIGEGLAPEVAESLVQQTIYGAAALLRDGDDSATTLRENVTSPNGTTQAGLEVFASAGFTDLVADVVGAAASRSRELGAA